jgi:hypothetical protein
MLSETGIQDHNATAILPCLMLEKVHSTAVRGTKMQNFETLKQTRDAVVLLNHQVAR